MEEIQSIKDYNTTIKKRKAEYKKTSDLVEEILKEGAISDSNLRLLVEEIIIHERNSKLRIEINLKAQFDSHTDIFN